jgi:hypothetical protein
MLSTRALEAAAAAVSMMALTGCTAGAVTNPDGTSWKPSGTGQVTFTNASTNAQYNVDVALNNGSAKFTTFSFDPLGPPSATNNPTQIPPGNYYVVVSDNISSYWSAPSGVVNVNYSNTCQQDTYTGSSVPCDLFQLVVNPCGSQNKPGITTSGNLTTVQLFRFLCN